MISLELTGLPGTTGTCPFISTSAQLPATGLQTRFPHSAAKPQDSRGMSAHHPRLNPSQENPNNN